MFCLVLEIKSVYGTCPARDDELLCDLSWVLGPVGVTLNKVGNSITPLCSYGQPPKQDRVDGTASLFYAVMNKYILGPAWPLNLLFFLKETILYFSFLNLSWIKIFLEPDQLFWHVAAIQIPIVWATAKLIQELLLEMRNCMDRVSPQFCCSHKMANLCMWCWPYLSWVLDWGCRHVRFLCCSI